MRNGAASVAFVPHPNERPRRETDVDSSRLTARPEGHSSWGTAVKHEQGAQRVGRTLQKSLFYALGRRSALASGWEISLLPGVVASVRTGRCGQVVPPVVHGELKETDEIEYGIFSLDSGVFPSPL